MYLVSGKFKVVVVVLVILTLAFSGVPLTTSMTVVKAEEQTSFYVSPEGDDTNPGTAALPFKTIAKAQQAAQNAGSSATVIIRQGVYYQTQPLVFTAKDSNSTYQAYPGEKPVISGGKEISGGWQKEGNLFYKDLGTPVNYYFRNLYVGNEKRQRARQPNASSQQPNQVQYRNGPVAGHPKDAISFKPGEMRQYENLSDVMLNLYQLWLASQHWLTSVDTSNNIAFFRHSTWFSQETNGYWNDPKGRYYLENAKEFIDVPGEWYLNRSTGRLYYYPMPGETVENLTVIAPQMSKLVKILGTNSEQVNNLSFKGITFTHTDWNTAEAAFTEGQSHERLDDAMIYAQYADNCTWQDCEITLGGSHGIFLEKGCNNNLVQRTHIHTMGGGGVYIGEHGWKTNYTPAPGDENQYNTVDNCIIHDLSHFFHGSCNIWVGSSNYNKISHNDLFDNDYCGISVGWTWDKNVPSTNHDNLIEKNHVHHLGHKEVSDFGGIYLLGNSPGTIVRNNVVHHIQTYSHGHGIYLDNGCSSVLVEQNLVYKIDNQGAFAKGDDNVIKNNIFAFTGDKPLWKYFESDRDPSREWNTTFTNNIVVTHKGQDMFFTDEWNSPVNTMDNNIYWDINYSDSITFSGRNLSEWQATNHDTHSQVTDPLFSIPAPQEPADFRLQPNSPALAMGFVEPDVADAGVYGDAGWRNMPQAYVPKYNAAVYEALGPVGDGTPPLQPVNLTAAVDAAFKVTLNWTDNSDTESQFIIKRKTISGVYTEIARVDANTTTYVDEGMALGPTYYYVIAAVNANGVSGHSNEASVKVSSGAPVGNYTEKNVAVNKPVTASGGTWPGMEKEKGNDGDTGSAWCTQNVWSDQWWQVDLGKEYRLSKIEVVDRPGTMHPEDRRNFKILASKTADFAQSVILGQQGPEDFGDDTTWVASVEYEDTYRYVKYVKTADWEGCFAELRVIAYVPVVSGPVADLSNVSVSSGTLTPSFDPAVTSYTVEVPNAISSIQVSALVDDTAKSAIKINGTDYVSGQMRSINLNVGENPVAIDVASLEDSTVKKTYTIVIRRAVPMVSENLVQNGGFEEGTAGWLPKLSDFSITPEDKHSGAKAAKIVATGQWAELARSNAVTLQANKDYTFSFWAKGFGFCGVFVKDVATNSVIKNASGQDVGVWINSSDTFGGWHQYKVSFNSGAHTSAYIFLQQGDANAIGKALYLDDFEIPELKPVGEQTDTTLSTLIVNGGSLTPAFSKDILSYTVNVPSEVTSVSVSAQASDAQNTTVTINGEAAGTKTIQLAYGSNPVGIVVKAVNGTSQKTYSINIKRAHPSGTYTEENVALNKPVTGSNSIPGYGLEKANDGDVKTYWCTQNVWSGQWWQVDLGQEYQLARIEVVDRQGTAHPEDRRNFKILASKAADFAQSVILGQQGPTDFDDDTTWTANVESGESYRYVKYVKTADWEACFAELRVIAKIPVAGETSVNLANLTVSSGTLTPAFNKDILSYTVNAGAEVNSITVSAQASNAQNTTMTINGEAANTRSIQLTYGSNPVDVVVKAVNGTSQKTYSIIINRANPVTDTIIDTLDDWSQVDSSTDLNNWIFAIDSAVIFDGDGSRAVRKTAKASSLIYSLEDITDFKAKVYYQSTGLANEVSQGVKFYVSSDKAAWTLLPSVIDSSWGAPFDGWRGTYFVPKDNIPDNMNYLRMEFDDSGSAAALQLCEIVITNKEGGISKPLTQRNPTSLEAEVTVNASSPIGTLVKASDYNNVIGFGAHKAKTGPVDLLRLKELDTEIYRMWVVPEGFYDSVGGSYNNDYYKSYFEDVSGITKSILINTGVSFAKKVINGTITIQKYKEVTKELIKHYKQKYPKIQYVEALNEPDMAEIHGADLYMFYKAHYQAVNEVNEELGLDVPLKVGGPTICSFGPDKIQAFLDNYKADTDPGKRLDFISYHIYLGSQESTPAYVNDCRNQRSLVRSYLAARGLNENTPVFITEQGVWPGVTTGSSDGVSNDTYDMDIVTQAAGMAAIHYQFINQGDGVYPFQWVTHHDYNTRKDQLAPTDGMLTPYGNMLKMFSMMKENRVAAASNSLSDPGVGVYVLGSSDETGVAALVWNYQADKYTDGTEYGTTVNINNLPAIFSGKNIRVKRYLIDSAHSNFKHNLSKAELEMVEDKVVGNAGSYSTRISLEKNAVSLIVLEPTNEAPATLINMEPVAMLHGLADGDVLKLPATLSMRAGLYDDDKAEISKVEFLSGATLLFSSTQAPFNYSWNIAQAGDYQITARITYNGAKTAVSKPIKLKVISDNLKPEVSAGPDQTITVMEPAVLNAQATDDGMPYGTLETKWTAIVGPEGTIAYDSNGNAYSTAVTFMDMIKGNTSAVFAKPGTYVLQYSAYDGELTGKDTVTVTVTEGDIYPHLINIALGKAASASSYYQNMPSLAPAMLVDNNIETDWATAWSTKTDWAVIDLGQEYAIKRVEVVTRQLYDQDATRNKFKIQVSNNSDFSQSVTLGEQGQQMLPYRATWVVNTDSPNTYRYVRYIRSSSNTYSGVAEIRVYTDKLTDTKPPVTTAKVTGNYVDGWYSSNVTVTFTAVDEPTEPNAGSNAVITEYKLTVTQASEQTSTQPTDGFVVFTGPIKLNDGVYRLEYFSKDQAGNAEAAKTLNISVDSTPPKYTVYMNGVSVANAVYEDAVLQTFSIHAVDSLSGISKTNIWIDNVPYVQGNPLDFAGKLGVHKVRVEVSDLAGNTVEEELSFTIKTSFASIRSLIDRYEASGELHNSIGQQLTNALKQAEHQLSKGDDGKAVKHLEDFLKHLEKCPSNKISTQAKIVLKTDASSEINRIRK